MRTMLIFLIGALPCAAWGQAAAIQLTCNLTKTEVVYTGSWTNGRWKDEKTTSYIENIDIDLGANTWITRADMQSPNPLVNVSETEFVLLNHSIGTVSNNLRINRVTGQLLQDYKRFDRDKNESVVSHITGPCKKNAQGSRQF